MSYRKLSRNRSRYVPHEHDPVIGKWYWFEYHCWEDESSADAELWHHTHQRVQVIGRGDGDMDDCPLCPEEGMSSMWNSWKIRFKDGYTHTAAPDELLTSKSEFTRPDYEKEGSYRKLSDIETQIPIMLKFYQKNRTSWPHWTDESFIEHIRRLIRETDPTGNEATYGRWLARIDSSPNRWQGRSYEDVAKLLKRYHQLKKMPATKGRLSRDITEYPTYDDLKEAVDEFKNLKSKRQEKEERVEGVVTRLEEFGEVKETDDGHRLLFVEKPEKVMDFVNSLGIEAWCIRWENYASTYAPVVFLISPDGSVLANLESHTMYVWDRQNDTTREYNKLFEEVDAFSWVEGFEEEKREQQYEREAEQSWEEWKSEGMFEALEALELNDDELEEWQRERVTDLIYYDDREQYVNREEGNCYVDKDEIAKDADWLRKQILEPEHPNQLELKFSYRKLAASDVASEVRSRVEQVLRIAEDFLDYLGEGNIDSIWLVGSRATGKTHEHSDWDFLVVGDGLNDAEDERIRLAEEDELPFQFRKPLSVDAEYATRSDRNDIIFSSTPPKRGQPAIRVYP